MFISKILSLNSCPNHAITLLGWIRSFQAHNNVIFIYINDGTTVENLQVVLKDEFFDVSTLSNGAAVEVSGTIQESKRKEQKYELISTEIKVLSPACHTYPIKNQAMTMEYLRTVPHQKHRSLILHAVALVKKEITFAFHQFFYSKSFCSIMPPILTTNNCEGGSEVFELSEKGKDFFKKDALLSVSGQFYAEACALGLQQVYCLAPTFRAEKSNSSFHLSEFWMLEAEISFYSMKKMIPFIEEMIKKVTKHVLDKCVPELTQLQTLIPDNTNLIEKLQKLLNKDFQIIEYTDAIKLLQQDVDEGKVKFATNEFEFGCSLQSEHERHLAEQIFDGPVFVINYPRTTKAFYMKQKKATDTVSAVDLLFPTIGEMIGGSERETDIELIKKNAEELNIPLDELNWYLDLRKYGYHKSSGFGLGFERFIMFFTGVKNIKDAVLFPRSYQQIGF